MNSLLIKFSNLNETSSQYVKVYNTFKKIKLIHISINQSKIALVNVAD